MSKKQQPLWSAAELTNRMIDARNAAQFLTRDKYESRVREWIDLIEAVGKDRDIGDIETACLLVRNLVDAGHDGAAATMWVLAALLELTEQAMRGESSPPAKVGT